MIKLLNINKFGIILIVCGAIAQLWVYFANNESCLSLISGLSGLLAVVFCSERKIIFYVFGFLQLITYCILAWKEFFYGEIFENIFYAITMIIGIIIWKSNYDYDNDQVKVKTLSKLKITLLFLITIISTYICYYFLSLSNDTQPFLDAVTTVPAIVAQILLILRYREQWWFWLIIDVGSIIMWMNAGNMIMMIQFIIWTINCIYGISIWKNKNK